jgi:hypothetical protein
MKDVLGKDVMYGTSIYYCIGAFDASELIQCPQKKRAVI